MKTKKLKAKRDTVVSPFRNRLWQLFADLSRGMDGAEVVLALKQAGEEVWAVGIDAAYTEMRETDQDSEPLGNAFDIAWLTIVCIKVKEMRQGKKPRVRIKA